MKSTVLVNMQKGIVTQTNSEILKIKLEAEGFTQLITVEGFNLNFFTADKLEYLSSRAALNRCLCDYKKDHMFACHFKKGADENIGYFYADNLKAAKIKAKEWHGKNFIKVERYSSPNKTNLPSAKTLKTK